MTTRDDSRIKIYIDSTILAYAMSEPTTDMNVLFKKRLSEMTLDRLYEAENIVLCTSNIAITELLESGFSIVDCKNILRRIVLLNFVDDSQKICSLNSEFVQQPALSNAFDVFHRAIAISNNVGIIVSWNMSQICNYDDFTVISTAANQLGTQCPIVCTPLQLSDLNHWHIDEVAQKLEGGYDSCFLKYTTASDEFSWSVDNFRRFIDINLSKYSFNIKQEEMNNINYDEKYDITQLDVHELISNSHLALKKGELYNILWLKYQKENLTTRYSEIRDWILNNIPLTYQKRDAIAHRSAYGILQAAGIYKKTADRRNL